MQKFLDNLNGKIITYEKNQIIRNEGEECNSLLYIIEGEVKVYTYSYNENTYLINTLKDKQVLALQLLFASNNYFLGNLISNKRTKIKIITKQTLLDALQNKTFLQLYLNTMSNNFISLQNRLKVLSQKSIKDKILFYLEHKSNEINSKKIPIKSKIFLAEYLNIPRPSLSRELINLQQKKLIIFDRHSITLLF